MKKFSVRDGVALERGETSRRATPACADGLRVDVENRIWTSAGESVHCYEPDGTLIGEFYCPSAVDLALRRSKRTVSTSTATSSWYSVLVAVSGAKTL